MNIDTREVEQIADPLERAQAADTLLATAELMVKHLKKLRADAMSTHARAVGGYKAANDSVDVIEHDESYWQRQAAALNVRLRGRDKTKEGIDVWWNLTRQPALGQRTPLQAWIAGDREAVLALVP